MHPASPTTPHASHRHLKTASILYFLQFAAWGISLTFINVYYSAHGLSGVEIGLVTTGGALVAVFSATLWGYLSDRSGQARYLLAVGAAGAAVSFLLVPLARTFPAFLLLACVYSFFNSAVITLVDATTLALLGEHREDYGRYRLGGTFGYILSTLTAGYIFEGAGMGVMFPGYAVVMVIFALVCLRLPAFPVRIVEQHRREFGEMLRHPRWLIFAGSAFLIWLAYQGSMGFLGITIKHMGGGDGLVGLAASMSAITEIPFMLFSGAIMRRIGVGRLFWLSTFVFILRTGLYAFMPAPTWAVGINALNGPTFVFFWNSSVNYASQMAPDSFKSTAQGVLQTTVNLASVIGALASGWMFDTLGPGGLYRVLAGLCLAAFVLFSFIQVKARKRQYS
jgi:PPP family 3-phenylpropionic acid transporter